MPNLEPRPLKVKVTRLPSQITREPIEPIDLDYVKDISCSCWYGDYCIHGGLYVSKIEESLEYLGKKINKEFWFNYLNRWITKQDFYLSSVEHTKQVIRDCESDLKILFGVEDK